MGIYWNRHLLRNDYAFDSIVEEVARDAAVSIRDREAETAPYHSARLAMANRVLAGRDEVVAAFYRELKDRAVRSAAFIEAAFANAAPDANGRVLPRAQDIPDEMLRSGVEQVWNDATLAAWPTILDDIG